MRGPNVGSNDWQALNAFWTSGEPGLIALLLSGGVPSFGSEKPGTPFVRMQAANFAIALAHSAC